MTQDEVLTSIKEHVSYAKQFFEVVQFSPEDATRTEIPFLIECVQTAINAGATIINIPDTVGFSYPTEYGEIFKQLINRPLSQILKLSLVHIVIMILEWQLLIV